jgi:hypothetical protein
VRPPVQRSLQGVDRGRQRGRLQEGLKRLGWTEKSLTERQKGDPEKVRLAQRLREETMVTLGWIARRLQMGSVAYLTNRLYLLRKGRLG